MVTADLTHAVLARITQFVRGLSADQLADLGTGTARLTLVPADTAATSARPAGRELPLSPDEVRGVLRSTSDRAEASRYLDGLRLTLAQLRVLAKGLNLAVPASASKTQVRDTIVQWTVGRRVDGSVLSRPATPRP